MGIKPFVDVVSFPLKEGPTDAYGMLEQFRAELSHKWKPEDYPQTVYGFNDIEKRGFAIVPFGMNDETFPRALRSIFKEHGVTRYTFYTRGVQRVTGATEFTDVLTLGAVGNDGSQALGVWQVRDECLTDWKEVTGPLSSWAFELIEGPTLH